jgi:peptide/nickel transport system permease protein
MTAVDIAGKTPAAAPSAPPTGQGPGRRRGLARQLLGSKKALSGLCLLVVFATLALLAPVLAPGDPSLINSTGSQAPSGAHWLGTTTKGQDVLALTLWGARSSMFVGFTVGLAATGIAILVGLAAAYFGRLVDDALTLITNVFLLLPGLPLLVILAAFLPPGTSTVVLVLVITGWAGSARVLRAQARSIRGKDFVAAAVVTGERPLRIMFREILPNMASVVMTTLLGCVVFGITSQAALESSASATAASSAGAPTSTGPATTAR